VAIVVGSLPAFANFLRKYVAESSIYKSIRFGLFASSGNSEYEWQQKDQVATFGSPEKERKKLSYYELSEGSTLKSNVAAPGEIHLATDDVYNDRIMRTVRLTQEEHKTGSVDRLV
jgi:hypothetical protein